MADELKKELIEITGKLISFDTQNPPGNESRCSKYIISLLKKAGLNTKVLYKNKKRINVIGEVGGGKRSLVIASHMDTVPAGSGWKTNPLKAAVKKGKIYGRGAIDDKGPFAISYLAVTKFLADFPDFKGKIFLVALADEEANNEYGIKYLLSNGFKAVAGLIPDGGYFSKFDIGEKGCVQIKIESFGKQAHSALDTHGENALGNLVEVVEKIKKIDWPNKYNKLFTPTKVNFSMFHSGEMANVVPPYAYVQMDIRFPLGITSDLITAAIKKVISSCNGKFKVNIIYKTEPHLVQDKKLIEIFIKASKKAGYQVRPITLAGNSVAKEFNEAGIPSIVHYPMERITAHEPNEFLDIKQALKTVNLYYFFLKEYFNP